LLHCRRDAVEQINQQIEEADDVELEEWDKIDRLQENGVNVQDITKAKGHGINTIQEFM
jgi:hypothetical protein